LVVANDDPDACEVVARVLELDGYEVSRVAGAEAVAGVVQRTGSTGVLLDLMDGGFGANLEALERLRAGAGAPGREVRVVLVGAQESQELFGWQSGIDGFLVRPFHERDLRRVMADALDRADKDRRPFRDEAARRLG
jgi:CheY-like chemotaxis protein